MHLPVTFFSFILLLLIPLTSSSVLFTVSPSNVISTTSSVSFSCLALDWWPGTKCDYTWCPWEGASFLNLDLDNQALQNGVKTLAGEGKVFLRLGGSLCDFVRYDFPSSTTDACRDFSDPTNSTRVGYDLGSGCLAPSRWDDLNNFCSNIEGCTLIFGINALYGRTNETCAEGINCHDDSNANPCCTNWSGSWDPSNAEALLRYTIEQGHEVYGLEFGNELAGDSGIQAHLTADVYARDFCAFKGLVEEIWEGQENVPRVISPDNNLDAEWFGEFIKETFEICGGPDVVTWHQYILGAGVDSAASWKAFDPNILDGQISNGAKALDTINSNTPEGSVKPEVWMGEAGGAYNSGRPGVTDSFVSSFWYLDGFGILSEKGHSSFCRQTLVGGNYGLLQNTPEHEPNPDYYATLLWQRLMGRSVLGVTRDDGGEGEGDRDIRVYSHCLNGDNGGVAVLAINLSNQTSKTANVGGFDLESSIRSDYVMSAVQGDVYGQRVMLNGLELVAERAVIPDVQGRDFEGEDKGEIILEPLTYAFVAYEGVECGSGE